MDDQGKLVLLTPPGILQKDDMDVIWHVILENEVIHLEDGNQQLLKYVRCLTSIPVLLYEAKAIDSSWCKDI